ncbi:MAG: hypothetical protein ISS63_15860 [Desulfobacteraceae bacterium]|nr:hypothetical protein [Desulfobacteraceae bacterium]
MARLSTTPVTILEQFRDLALKERIRYVYLGNVPGHEGCHTYCHNCRKVLIARRGYSLSKMNYPAAEQQGIYKGIVTPQAAGN